MPGVKAVRDLSPDERHRLYREQLRVAYQDGAVDGRERQMPQAARAYLGIRHEEAEALERDVAGAG